MTRRRLYVFVAIIAAGVLVGVYCLRDAADNQKPGSDQEAKGKPDDGRLAVADMSDTRGAVAQGFLQQARAAGPPEKAKLLRKAYDADPTGTWGGEAAAELGRLCEAQGDPESAAAWYKIARRAMVSPETLTQVNKKLSTRRLSTETPALSRIKLLSYKIQPGDALSKIAKRYAVTAEAIMQANRMRTTLIRANRTLRVPQGPFDVRITKRNHTLQLLQDGRPVKAYAVGLGKDGRTPTGTWTVSTKLTDPVWFSPDGEIPPGDPRNVLGSRWIGFNDGIGIHGIRQGDEHTIGKNMSEGCIRMRDTDVRELYTFLTRRRSKVTIVE